MTCSMHKCSTHPPPYRGGVCVCRFWAGFVRVLCKVLCGAWAMSAESAFTRSWSVGARTVTMTAARPTTGMQQSVAIEWLPDMPECLTPAELAEYRTGRNRAVRELAEHFGRKVAIVEVT